MMCSGYHRALLSMCMVGELRPAGGLTVRDVGVPAITDLLSAHTGRSVLKKESALCQQNQEHEESNTEGWQPCGQLLLLCADITSLPFLEQTSRGRAKRYYHGKKQPPHRTRHIFICTAVSSQCHSARWQAAQARAFQTLLAFVSMQSEFSYIPRELQPWRGAECK